MLITEEETTMNQNPQEHEAAITGIARREFLAEAGALAIAAIGGGSLLTAPSRSAEAQGSGDLLGDLVVCVPGGAWETAFREHMAKPFSQKYPKVKLHIDLSTFTAQLAKLRAARGVNPPFDVILLLDDQMDVAVREGLIDLFDTNEVPNAKDMYSVSTPAKWQKDGKFYAIHQNWGQLGITYRTDKLKTPPKEWLDFWKPEYKGLIGMPPISYSIGLQFFIATIHALGGDEKNPADVDRGFEKMKGLKASLAQQPADAGAIQQLLERGDIAIVPLWDGRAHGLAAAGLPIGFSYPSKPGPVASGAGIAIPKGTKNRAAALRLTDFRLSPEPQKAFCQAMWYAPSNNKVRLDPKYAAKVAYGTEHYAKLLSPNYDVVSEKLGEWTQRWAAIFTG
jgi:putative spermidine/putrescine transport system substrate-binding protein